VLGDEKSLTLEGTAGTHAKKQKTSVAKGERARERKTTSMLTVR